MELNGFATTSKRYGFIHSIEFILQAFFGRDQIAY